MSKPVYYKGEGLYENVLYKGVKLYTKEEMEEAFKAGYELGYLGGVKTFEEFMEGLDE